jgi:hypothetical protein
MVVIIDRQRCLARGQYLGDQRASRAKAQLLYGQTAHQAQAFFSAENLQHARVPLGLAAVHEHFAFPLGIEQIVVAFGELLRLHQIGVVRHHAGIVVSADPVAFLVFEILGKCPPLRRVVHLKQAFFEDLIELKTGRGDDVEQVDAAAVLLQHLDDDLRAAETQQLGLDERIFLLERMDHRRAVADVRSAVVHEHFFFLGLGDDRIAILRPELTHE